MAKVVHDRELKQARARAEDEERLAGDEASDESSPRGFLVCIVLIAVGVMICLWAYHAANDKPKCCQYIVWPPPNQWLRVLLCATMIRSVSDSACRLTWNTARTRAVPTTAPTTNLGGHLI